MRGEVGEGGIWRERRFTGGAFYGRLGIDFEGLLHLQRGVEFWSGIVSVQAPGLP
jgi:hypothetical protein